jgi:hypothetical protein
MIDPTPLRNRVNDLEIIVVLDLISEAEKIADELA